MNFPERKEQKILVVLSEAQTDHIHRAIHDINFFDYPPQFVGVQQVERTIVTIPHRSYLMEVRESGAAHRVRWTDSTKPTTERGSAAGSLFVAPGIPARAFRSENTPAAVSMRMKKDRAFIVINDQI